MYSAHSHKPSDRHSFPLNRRLWRRSERLRTGHPGPPFAMSRATGSHAAGEREQRSCFSNHTIQDGTMFLVAILVLQYGQLSILRFSSSGRQRLPMRWLQGCNHNGQQGHSSGSSSSSTVSYLRQQLKHLFSSAGSSSAGLVHQRFRCSSRS